MKKISMFYVVVCLITFIIIPFVNAEEFSRAGDIEFFASGYFMGEETVDVDEVYGYNVSDMGIEIGIDNTCIWGLGMGYNINNHLNINLGWGYGSTDGLFEVPGIREEGDVDLYDMNLNIDYNILKGRLTPLITVGIGCIGIDIEDNEFDSLFGGVYATANAGIGFRYNVPDNHVFVKALYRVTWVDELDHTDDNLVFDGFNFIVGFRF